MKYKKKEPLFIDAVKWDGHNIFEVRDLLGKELFIKTCSFIYLEDHSIELTIFSPNDSSNLITVRRGDYIFHSEGETIYIIDEKYFDSQYEPIS